MIKIVVAGFKGKMGATATKMVLNQPKMTLVGVLDPHAQEKNINELAEYSQNSVPVFNTKEGLVKEVQPDVWIDFTIPAVAFENTHFALSQGISPVVGTTGFSDDELVTLQTLAKAQQTGGLIAPNFAVGAVLMMEFAQKAAKYFPDAEIIELHHDNKLDAPSGTALKTAEMMSLNRQKKVQGHPEEKELLKGARGADYEGMKIHSVRLPGLIAHQEVLFGNVGEGLTIRHDSYDRESFMTGVKLSCEAVVHSQELIYGLENIL